ncbi:FAD-binding domain-containing protein [Mycena crocata]|nr:FAD-binding domain-containing protein [Mycena crocata]
MALAVVQWDALNTTVHGQLYPAVPFARSCFPGSFDAAACLAAQTNYLNGSARSDHFSAYMANQAETCQSTGAQCGLNWQNVSDSNAFSPPRTCSQGSVPPHYIDVKNAGDVQAAFSFASRTGVHIVIKNTGHDYNGRSSSPDSLGLWSHNLKSISYNARFTAQNCPSLGPFSAVTVGAGVQNTQMFEFADAHNVTVPGGACPTVGTAGGYLQGGGHSWLSNIHGLAVDRVLEFEVVTPSGQHLFANACQNSDLFFALRGGGGGTFGFVLAVTTKALPRAAYTSIEVTYSANATTLPKFVSFLISNAVKWSTDAVKSGQEPASKLVLSAVNTNEAQAASYMSSLRALAAEIGGTFSVKSTSSYLSFHNTFVVPDTLDELDGIPQTVGSRLISADTFSANPDKLLTSLVAMINASPVSFIFANAPYGFKQDVSLGPASVTPAWRNSVWHVVAGTGWTYDTPSDIQSVLYSGISSSFDPIRAITPSSGAYQNEADLHEPNYTQSFWGNNYQRLLQIKGKYDPNHLLDCWHCVGWSGASNKLFSCYL